MTDEDGARAGATVEIGAALPIGGAGADAGRHEEVLEALRMPYTYGPAAGKVSVSETDLSMLYFVGDQVFAFRKPVFGPCRPMLARREADCREELRVNGRLAPGVYLGLSAVQRTARGLRVVPEEAAGAGVETVEWLVRMRRLPKLLRLDRRIARREVTEHEVDALADTLIAFYRRAPAQAMGPDAYVKRFMADQRMNREALLGARWMGAIAAPALHRLDEAIERERTTLGLRATSLVRGHGDLRPERVFMTEPPRVVGSPELGTHAVHVDPYDELASLGLECSLAGAPWIGTRLYGRVARLAGNEPSPSVLRLYKVAAALTQARRVIARAQQEGPVDAGRWQRRAARYVEHAAMLWVGAAAGMS